MKATRCIFRCAVPAAVLICGTAFSRPLGAAGTFNGRPTVDRAAPLWPTAAPSGSAQAESPSPLTVAQTPADTSGAVDIYGFRKKSPRRAFLQSFLVPGWGQWYSGGSKLKALLFIGLEAGSWLEVSHFYSNGKNREKEYKSFADQHWNEGKYLQGLYQVFYSHELNPKFLDSARAGEYDSLYLDTEPVKYRDRNDTLRVKTFSHHAYFKDPPRDTATGVLTGPGKPVGSDEYYENVGKYDQFTFGWDDYPGIGDSGFPTNLPIPDARDFTPADSARYVRASPNRLAYLHMREHANTEYKRASTFVVAAIGNHLLSAFWAAIDAKRYNRSQDQFGGIETRLQFVQSPTSRKYIPKFTVAYRF